MHYFKLQNLKFKHLTDDIIIDIRSSRNFANVKDIRKNVIQWQIGKNSYPIKNVSTEFAALSQIAHCPLPNLVA